MYLFTVRMEALYLNKEASQGRSKFEVSSEIADAQARLNHCFSNIYTTIAVYKPRSSALRLISDGTAYKKNISSSVELLKK